MPAVLGPLFASLVFLFAALIPDPLAAEGGERPRINGKVPPYPVWHHLVMPGRSLELRLPPGQVATLDGEPIGKRWTAPEMSGNHRLEIAGPDGRIVQTSTVFVLTPADRIDQRGYLEGYRIGRYPRNRPAGFIRLMPGDLDLPVSPSLTIGQYICKQQPGHYPKFLLVTEANLLRLERLLTALRDAGITEARSFTVMSGFRTPFYNTAIGSARLSRHMYGDASDVYVDVSPRDGVMDDLNGDGRINKADADFLYDFASRLFTGLPALPSGGLGSYRANAVHGPFVHIDGRGRAARWGR